MKIDAHQHFWIYNSRDYGWISEKMKIFRRNYLPSDLQPQMAEAGFSGTIAVQARQTVEETRWLLDLADNNSFIRGVVGWVDLCSADNLKQQLDYFCRSEKLVGVRHVVHDEPDDNFMLRDDFLKGISLLKSYNMTYDLLLFPKHLPVACKVVSMFPDQRFVLDHISKPRIKEHVITPWKEDILKLAQNKNVWCKLSGMVTEADPGNWNPGVFRPYLDVVLKAFGPERLMTGSDWPVCLLSGGYKEVVSVVEDYISSMPVQVREKILGLNCKEFYGV
jgi:L-fuconolactonase